MKLIVTSTQDIAGTNMYNLFVDEFGFEKEEHDFDGFPKYRWKDFMLIHIRKEIIDLDYLNKEFKPELYICASRHSAKKEVKTLTVHSTGNWSSAELGGAEKELNLSPALYMRKAIQALNANPVEGFETVLEVTHHGPSAMNAPLLFVEVGSKEEEWRNIDACRAVCKAVLSLADVDEGEDIPVGIGFGGPHYGEEFTKLLSGKFALGHICPGHYVDDVDEDMVRQAIEKTVPTPTVAVLDWKGLYAPQREKLISLFDKVGIKWSKLKDLRKTVG